MALSIQDSPRLVTALIEAQKEGPETLRSLIECLANLNNRGCTVTLYADFERRSFNWYETFPGNPATPARPMNGGLIYHYESKTYGIHT